MTRVNNQLRSQSDSFESKHVSENIASGYSSADSQESFMPHDATWTPHSPSARPEDGFENLKPRDWCTLRRRSESHIILSAPKKKDNRQQRKLSEAGIKPNSNSATGVGRSDQSEMCDEIEGGDQRPPYSYASLIAQAINSSDNGLMKLNDIYGWIMDQYPFYKGQGTGWQNSIRHNLSLNKSFVKVPCPEAESGKGSYWKISEQDQEFLDGSGNFKKRRKSKPQVEYKSSRRASDCGSRRSRGGCEEKLVEKENNNSLFSSQEVIPEEEENATSPVLIERLISSTTPADEGYHSNSHTNPAASPSVPIAASPILDIDSMITEQNFTISEALSQIMYNNISCPELFDMSWPSMNQALTLTSDDLGQENCDMFTEWIGNENINSVVDLIPCEKTLIWRTPPPEQEMFNEWLE